MAPRTRVTPGVMVDFAAYEEEMKAIICSLISSVLFYLFPLFQRLWTNQRKYIGFARSCGFV